MKHGIKRIAAVCMALFLVLGVIPVGTGVSEVYAAESKIYYVDAENGNDSNDGLSETEAWKTIDKINGTTFEAGSQILFKRGQAWSGNLIITSSGTEDARITYGAYGEGERPLINGLGDSNDGLTKSCTAAVLIRDAEYVTVQDLAVTNLGVNAEGKPNDVEELGKNEALRSGIMIMGTRGDFGGQQKALKGIEVKNNEIYNVKGSTNRYPSSGYDMYHNAGIYVWLEGSTGDIVHFDGLLIENNIIRDMSCQGINFNVEIAGDYNFKHDRYNKNVVIRGNTISRTGADAIVVEYCDKVLVERNVGYNAGEKTSGTRPSVIAGIWQSNANDAVFQYNECARTRFFNGDGMAWDTDWGSGGTALYQYNYSHENEGGMLMDCNFNSPKYEGWIVRYNLSVNEPGKQWTITSTHTGNIHFYNNTVYIAPGGGRIKFNEKEGVKNYYTNNIFVADNIEWTKSKSEFNNNLLWGNGNEVEFPERAVNTWYANPKFADTSAAEVTELRDGYIPVLKNEGALDGFDKTEGWKLTSDSPAIDRGIDVEDPYEQIDLFGQTLDYGDKRDIGACEFQGAYTGGEVEKLPITGTAGVEAELYDATDSGEIIEEGNITAVKGIKDGASLRFNSVKLPENMQSVRFIAKVPEETSVTIKIGEKEESFELLPTDTYRRQVVDFSEEIAAGVYPVEIKVHGKNAEEFAVDKFYLLPLQPKSYEVPYIYRFEEDVEGWKAQSGKGEVYLSNGKLVLDNVDEKVFYASELSPMIQDGIVEFDLFTGENAKVTGIVRYDLDMGKNIEIGMDGVGTKYWFMQGNYDGMSHIQFSSPNLPIVEENHTYRVKVKMEGAHFTVWIDGVQVFDQTIEGLEVGSGGVGACKWNGNKGALAELDNIKVNTGTIKGRVVGANGVGVADVSMSLNGDEGYATTDAQGYYEFDVPVEWGKEYTISGHHATGNLEEKVVTTSFENDTVEVDYTLEIAGADKTELRTLIDKAEKLDVSNYEEEAWTKIQELIQTAYGLEGDINAKQEDIDALCTELETAIANVKDKIQIPYTWTFEQGLESWTGMNAESEISLVDEQMLIKALGRSGLWKASNVENFADGAIEFDFTPVAPQEGNFIGGKASIVFRMNEEGTEFVEFGVDKLNRDYWFIAGSGIPSNIVMKEAPVLKAGQTYHIKVEFEGEKVSVWVDDVQLFSESIPGVRTDAGTIGIRTWDPTEVLFDNIAVTGVRIVDKSGLQTLVDEVENIDLEQYLTSGKEELAAALENAKQVLQNGDASQEDVDGAIERLSAAKAALIEKPDKSGLETLIKETEGIDRNAYTSESLAKLDQALEQAYAVMENAEADSAAVEAAVESLTDAKNGLEKIPVDPGEPEEPENPEKPEEKPEDEDENKNPEVPGDSDNGGTAKPGAGNGVDNQAVETGDDASVILMLSGILVSAGIVCAMCGRKKIRK